VRVYITQEQGGPAIPLGTGLSFRRLLLLTGLRWRYSNPPPHVKVKVTFRLKVSQCVGLGVEPPIGLMARYLLSFDSYGRVFVGREDEPVFCICCWLLSVHSFSGPSPLGIRTIFYCLRFETFLFFASYHSQGHGGGIRPRLRTD
jgi:hypothetical protein